MDDLSDSLLAAASVVLIVAVAILVVLAKALTNLITPEGSG